MFFPWLLVGSASGSLISWLLNGANQPSVPGWVTGGALGVIGVLRGVEMMRSQPVREMDAVARLDDHWDMNQSLVRAYCREGDWPALPLHSRISPLRVRWQVWSPPICLSLLFIALSQWIPIVESAPSAPVSRSAPVEWQELESLVETLEEEDIVEPDALEEFQDQLDRLQAMPEQEWYGPAGLEATDRLRDQVKTQANRLHQGLQQTARLLQVADANQAGLSLSQQSALQEEMQRLLQQMGENGMPLSQQQLQSLRQVDLSKLDTISKEQLRKLQDQLQGQCQATEAALMASGLLTPGGYSPAPGTEGGGAADLGLGEEASAGNPMTQVILDLKEPEALEAGDLLETREIEHRDRQVTVIPSAGTVSGPGGSGSATWQRDLSPSEQRVLQQFFKSNSAP